MKLISYVTKPEQTAENRGKIEAVFAALQKAGLTDFSYMVVEAGEGEFFHFVEATPTSLELFQALPEFQAFSTTAADRQAAPSTRRGAKVVGSYGSLVTP